MCIPAEREFVGLRSWPGSYWVLTVNHIATEADLLRMDECKRPCVLPNVPFDDILPLAEKEAA
jgi:hypothetical protein